MSDSEDIAALERVRARKLEERRRNARRMLESVVIPGLPIDGDARELRSRTPRIGDLMDGITAEFLRERNSFFESLSDRWDEIFPGLPILPGRFADGKYYIRVKSAATLFMMRPKLPMIKKTLSMLEGAPKKLELRLEIRK